MKQNPKHRSKKKEIRKKKATKNQTPETSSWCGAVLSFLKEFFLNGDSAVRFSYEENLTKEGKRKKELIWAVLSVLEGMFLLVFPFFNHNIVAEHPAATLIVFLLGLFLLIYGILKSKTNQNQS